jgi:hypothetical protein
MEAEEETDAVLSMQELSNLTDWMEGRESEVQYIGEIESDKYVGHCKYQKHYG